VIFQLFYDFLHSGCIFSKEPGPHAPTTNNTAAVNTTIAADTAQHTISTTEWAHLCNAWMFGQKILSTSFKDAVTDAYRSKDFEENGSVFNAHGGYLYPRSSKNSGMRKLLVDIAVWHWPVEALAVHRNRTEAHHEFFFDVALASTKALKRRQVQHHADLLTSSVPTPLSSPVLVVGACEYHEHTDDPTAKCYRELF
jgi:hypothetical protein